jgi:predicted HicB family RNase H-like nuclease
MKTRRTMATDGNVKALNLRLPPELHRKLKAKAEAEVKSLNLVIVELIEKGFQTQETANQ